MSMRNLNLDELRDHCLEMTAVSESFPFDASTLVFKVAGKMFALCNVDHFTSVNLKCDPEQALELRERFAAVAPGWHMNKVHWNTVAVDSDASREAILKWVDDSYALVVASLPRKARMEHGL
jgi:predicted DNA-binding protein (MmcQ/YjbR family)